MLSVLVTNNTLAAMSYYGCSGRDSSQTVLSVPWVWWVFGWVSFLWSIL